MVNRLISSMLVFCLLCNVAGVAGRVDRHGAARQSQHVITVYENEVIVPPVLSAISNVWLIAKIHLYQKAGEMAFMTTPFLHLFPVAIEHGFLPALFAVIIPPSSDSYRLERMKKPIHTVVSKHEIVDINLARRIADRLNMDYRLYSQLNTQPLPSQMLTMHEIDAQNMGIPETQLPPLDTRIALSEAKTLNENFQFLDWLEKNDDPRIRAVFAALQVNYLLRDPHIRYRKTLNPF